MSGDTVSRFPFGAEIVYRPTGISAVIGEVQRFEKIDIALIKLSDGLSFKAKPFESPAASSAGLRESVDARVSERISMDSPFSGSFKKLVGKVEFRRAGPESTDHPFYWVIVIWTCVCNDINGGRKLQRCGVE